MCKEKVNIPVDKPYIFLEVNGAKATIIRGNDHRETHESTTFTSLADNFVAKDISFVVKKLRSCLVHVLLKLKLFGLCSFKTRRTLKICLVSICCVLKNTRNIKAPYFDKTQNMVFFLCFHKIVL